MRFAYYLHIIMYSMYSYTRENSENTGIDDYVEYVKRNFFKLQIVWTVSIEMTGNPYASQFHTNWFGLHLGVYISFWF